MRSHKKGRLLSIILVVIGIIFFIAMVTVILNHFGTNYKNLNSTDQKILAEYDAYCTSNKKDEIWNAYSLEHKTIVAINGTLGSAYLINPKEDVDNFFTAKIDMPKSNNLKVYRISKIAPQILSMRFAPGKFCTIGKTYSAFGSNVYYIKYNTKDSIDSTYSSRHFITFLSHEAFHYYMQNNWSGGNRFSEKLSDKDIELIGSEYNVLAKIQEELAKKAPSKDQLFIYTKEYVSIMEQRKNANPQYVESELSMETAEGTAQYIGIKASQVVDYDYGTMYFDNTKNVSFSDVIPMLKAGGIDTSFLSDRMPYEVGSLLCELMDELNIDDWQKELNAQTKDNPVTLFSVLRDFVNAQL